MRENSLQIAEHPAPLNEKKIAHKKPGYLTTDAPGKYVVLFDGLCRFCTRQSQRMVSLARPGVVEVANFQEAGALDRFPGITHDACMEAIHLVEPDGRVSKGPEAIVRTLATRPIFRWLPAIFFLPGMRSFLNGLYAFVASNRYRIWGKTSSPAECDGGTCHLHSLKKK
jgi:predicted DCC family thiol-disulfide oxidoreductase YuxK